MAEPKRKHRAAKRARQGGTDPLAALDEMRQPTPANIADAILAAVLETAQRGARGKSPRGDTVAAKRFAARLARGDLPSDDVRQGAYLAGQQAIARIFRNGWLPADIVQAARRRIDSFGISFLIDMIAAHTRPFAPDTVDETWLDQLRELKADIWWSETTPQLAQWADKHMLTTEEALTTVIEALALLVLLPTLELIRPLPGSARPHAAHHHVDEKVLGRVRGLLAKAESTDFPEEAETLSAKAQELMTKYALDRVLLHAADRAPDLPGARRMWLDTPYTDAKALLIDVVAAANRSRAVFASQWGFVTVVGEETDLDAVELLSTSLLVQATRAMIATGDRDTRGDDARSRPFRKAFLVAYATRIGERLAAATAATIAESPEPERLLPVLASHQVAVDADLDTLFPQVRNRGVTIRSAEGWEAGRAAADRARLG